MMNEFYSQDESSTKIVAPQLLLSSRQDEEESKKFGNDFSGFNYFK